MAPRRSARSRLISSVVAAAIACGLVVSGAGLAWANDPSATPDTEAALESVVSETDQAGLEAIDQPETIDQEAVESSSPDDSLGDSPELAESTDPAESANDDGSGPADTVDTTTDHFYCSKAAARARGGHPRLCGDDDHQIGRDDGPGAL